MPRSHDSELAQLSTLLNTGFGHYLQQFLTTLFLAGTEQMSEHPSPDALTQQRGHGGTELLCPIPRVT